MIIDASWGIIWCVNNAIPSGDILVFTEEFIDTRVFIPIIANRGIGGVPDVIACIDDIFQGIVYKTVIIKDIVV
jgi:hypothetical protein